MHRMIVLLAALTAVAAPASAESVIRYGISLADIPQTTGQPDRGAGAYQFTGYTIYDPLVAWEMNIADRPGKLIPGLATEWSVDPADQKKWRFKLREGVKFHDGSAFNADAVVWNLDKVLDEKAPHFDKRQSAQVKHAASLGRELEEARRHDGRDHHQGRRLDLPLSDALVPGLEPGAIREARQGLGQVRDARRPAPARSSSTSSCRASAPNW